MLLAEVEGLCGCPSDRSDTGVVKREVNLGPHSILGSCDYMKYLR